MVNSFLIGNLMICAAVIIAKTAVLGRIFFKALVPLAIFVALLVISTLLLNGEVGLYVITNAILWGSVMVTLAIVLRRRYREVFISFAAGASFSSILLAYACYI